MDYQGKGVGGEGPTRAERVLVGVEEKRGGG